jgi:hypothetical protein
MILAVYTMFIAYKLRGMARMRSFALLMPCLTQGLIVPATGWASSPSCQSGSHIKLSQQNTTHNALAVQHTVPSTEHHLMWELVTL